MIDFWILQEIPQNKSFSFPQTAGFTIAFREISF